MLPLISTVFVASLFGSLHCVGMCGPLALLASSSGSSRRPQRRGAYVPAVAAYHGSRVLAYTLLGLLAGLLGAGIQETGALMGMQRLAARLAGGSMLVIGLLGIVRLAGNTGHAALLPAWLQRRLASGHVWARQQSPLVRASAIGLLTAILPCGWLLAFVIVAAGTAQPLAGGLVMAVFALGSIPALTGLALSMTLLVGKFRRAIPWCSAILITFVGAVTLVERSAIKLEPMIAQHAASVASAESEPQTADSDSTTVQQVQAIDQQLLPCCQAAAERAARASSTLESSPSP